jgi:hypothetical protein
MGNETETHTQTLKLIKDSADGGEKIANHARLDVTTNSGSSARVKSGMMLSPARSGFGPFLLTSFEKGCFKS